MCTCCVLRFAVEYAFMLLSDGDLRGTRAWLLRAVTDDDVEAAEVQLRMVGPKMLCHAEQPLPDDFVVPAITVWSEALFVHDRFSGSLRGIASAFFVDYLQPWLLVRLPDDSRVFYLALAAAQWSRGRDVDDRELKRALRQVSARDR